MDGEEVWLIGGVGRCGFGGKVRLTGGVGLSSMQREW